MRNFLLAAAATLAVATPAAARDGSGYVGLDGGVLFPRSEHIRGFIDFTNTEAQDFGPNQVATVRYKAGYDVDLNAGYDFGMFRFEGELGYKHAKNKDLNISDNFVT